MKSEKYIRVEEGIIAWNKEKDDPKYKTANNRLDLVFVGDCCNGKKVIDKDEKYIYLSDGSKITEDEMTTHLAFGRI